MPKKTDIANKPVVVSSITIQSAQQRIFTVRGQQVMLDRDLAHSILIYRARRSNAFRCIEKPLKPIGYEAIDAERKAKTNKEDN
ncbi:MAG: hypothetical protein J6P74_04200 [Paludibacteraceae bacterium]|nr:hypothetical protein [Paludibacteraceae bacterium]